MNKKAYWELLRDPRWQRKRLEIMERAQFQCETCMAPDKTLNVHHRLYRKGAMPWDYADDELKCLCEDCHENEHQWRAALERVLAKLDPGSIEFVLGYAEGQLALSLESSDLQKSDIKVKSWEHAEGLLAALWRWNTSTGRPDPRYLIEHGSLSLQLFDGLIEGEIPNLRGNNGAD